MSMTKEQIRQELINHGIQVPSGNLKKEEYVKLFDEHVKPLTKATSNFSTDEEDEDQGPVQPDKVFELNTNAAQENEAEKKIISAMTDSALYEFLVKAGKNPGPVMSGTRSMYEKLAVKMLKEDPSILQKANQTSANGHENGNDEKDSNGYSDTDDDDEAIETASKASRASRASRTSSKVANKKLPVAESSSVDSGKSSTPSQGTYRQSLDTPVAQQKGSSSIDKRYGTELKNLRVRMEPMASTSTYRRVTETSGESSYSYKEKVSEPQGLLKKPKPKNSMMFFWIVFILLIAIAGVLFYSYSVTTVEGDEREKELDDILATLD